MKRNRISAGALAAFAHRGRGFAGLGLAGLLLAASVNIGMAAPVAPASPAASATPVASPAPLSAASATGAEAGDATYTLAPDDTFGVSVLGHPEYAVTTATVLPDGTFNYPVVGVVHAAGKTADQLAAILREKLISTGQLNAPDVTVTIIQSQPRNVSVIGDVKTPGLYAFKAGWHVLDAIAACGGPIQAPQLTSVTLVTPGAGQGVPIDVVKLMNGSDLSQNLALEPGDILMVQNRDPNLAEVQVTGDVTKPGEYVVDPSGSPVLSLITQAGGATENAALTRVQVMHDGQAQEVNVRNAMNSLGGSVNTIRVYAGDTIVVPDNTAQISVFGEVNKPAVYPIPDGQSITVPMAISLAGGATDEGDRTQIDIVRNGPDGKQVVTPVNLDRYLTGSTASLTLQPNDVVYVPSRRKGHSGTEAMPIFGALGALATFFHYM